MTRLVLVRHGVAGDADPKKWPDDEARPLTKKGMRRLKQAAPGLSKLVVPDRVVTSPYTRTLQTADILNWDGDWPAATADHVLDDSHSPKEMLDMVRKLDGKPQTVGLVGHGPSLGRLIQHLLNDGKTAVYHGQEREDDDQELEMPRGGAALIECGNGKLKGGKGKLVWVLTAKQLRKHA